MPAPVKVVNHPLIQHKLSKMRRKETSTATFRTVLRELSMLLAYEVTYDLPVEYEDIETPIAPMRAPVIHGENVVFVGVLRAGLGIVDGMLQILPTARVAHIGLYRDPDTLQAVEYYKKLPPDPESKHFIVVDPMLATGHTAIAALDVVKRANPRTLKFVSLLAAPEGIRALQEHHPDVPIFTAAIDDHLNDHAYIVPGLGDAGDRMFGTR